MMKSVRILVGAAGLCLASAALALPVSLESVSGTFENPQGGSNVNGVGTSQINWGKSTGNGQSGYRFDGASPLPLAIVDDSPFVLGSLTHINKPVTGNAISGVDLAVTLGFGGFGETGSAAGTFTFSHEETPNNAPVTSKKCFLFIFCWDETSYTGDVDDIVWLDEVVSSSEFQLGNYIYSLELIGLQGDITHFATAENGSTSIDLLARLNVTAIDVPEPGTLALLGMGLLALGASRRRQAAA